jgi:hypothetical protein
LRCTATFTRRFASLPHRAATTWPGAISRPWCAAWPPRAQPLIQAIILPLYFISGLLVPKDQLSSTLRDIASVFPVGHLDNALFKAFDPATTGSGIAATELLILAIWGAAGLFIALRRFKWSLNPPDRTSYSTERSTRKDRTWPGHSTSSSR